MCNARFLSSPMAASLSSLYLERALTVAVQRKTRNARRRRATRRFVRRGLTVVDPLFPLHIYFGHGRLRARLNWRARALAIFCCFFSHRGPFFHERWGTNTHNIIRGRVDTGRPRCRLGNCSKRFRLHKHSRLFSSPFSLQKKSAQL